MIGHATGSDLFDLFEFGDIPRPSISAIVEQTSAPYVNISNCPLKTRILVAAMMNINIRSAVLESVADQAGLVELYNRMYEKYCELGRYQCNNVKAILENESTKAREASRI
jgi:hypothetical protein